MDAKELKQISYPAYLTLVLSESDEKFSPFEHLVQKLAKTKKGALLGSFLENNAFIDDYIDKLHYYDTKDIIDTSEKTLQQRIDNDPELQQALQQNLKIDNLYTEQSSLKQEVLEYLNTLFSDVNRTVILSFFILEKLDRKHLQQELIKTGEPFIKRIESHTRDRRYGITLYYKSIARAMIRQYVKRMSLN